MPVYSFRRLDNNKIVERFISLDDIDTALDENRCITLEDGVKAQKDLISDAEQRQQKSGDWYTASYGLSLTYEHEVKPEMERARKHGVAVEFDNDLKPHFSSEGDFRKYQEICGVRNQLDYR